MKRVTKELREKVKSAGQEQLFKFLDAGKLSKKEVGLRWGVCGVSSLSFVV